MSSEVEETQQRMSRRRILGLAGAAGVVAVAGYVGYEVLDSLIDADGVPSQDVPDIIAVRISDPVPSGDPSSSVWKKAKRAAVKLDGQQVATPLKLEPSFPSVTVGAVHDGETIAFLMEWEDEEEDTLSIKTDEFRDACGVMLGGQSGGTAVWTMGTADQPVTILHWRADWQKDVDDGFQDLEVAFPNVAVDFYPPLVNAEHPLKLPEGYPEEARMWVPGWHVGNPISTPVKTSSVQKLIGTGPGTLEALATQNAAGKGVWDDGKWKVALSRPLTAADENEVDLSPGAEHPLALTVWSGAASDVGSRKSLTQLGKLTLEA